MSATIRLATREDVARVNAGLESLLVELGNVHPTDTARLAQAGWGPAPAFRAQLAELGDALVGVAVYSPQLSTSRGGSGLFVSDLWVAAEARSAGLGKRLLHAALLDAQQVWQARFMRLQVYDHTPAARRFYDRLGFTEATGYADLVLEAANFAEWKEMK